MTGTAEAALMRFEIAEVALTGVGEVGDRGEVVECLGEVLRAGLEGPAELDLLVEDLLLEQRRQHDGADTGVLELSDRRRSRVSGEAEATIGERSSRPR